MGARATATPQRTCVGCRETAPRGELLRLVRRADGGVRPDAAARLPGRGAWVHPRAACLEQAVRRGGLQRAFRAAVIADASALVAAARAALAGEIDKTTAHWQRGGSAAGPVAGRLARLRSAAGSLAGNGAIEADRG
jgi:predicted RNA-binding protein YlxR (DUF448 family)